MNPPEPTKTRTLWSGRHLAALSRDGWEFVTRHTQRPAIAIIAVTDERELLVVEQYRQAVARRVMELPAGLAGDCPEASHESLLDAAKRELLEETGYAAQRWTELGAGYTSPGLTDESIVFFLAEALRQEGPGGGDPHETIILHRVRLDDVGTWLVRHQDALDLKLLAGWSAAERHWRTPITDAPVK